MPKKKSPRKGSLQFWPRSRAKKILPRVNWRVIDSEKPGLNGFICYKAGMASAYLKDNTPNSLTKGKNVIVPVTVLECPAMKILSIRFYKYGKVAKEILLEKLEKELKKKIKFPKKKMGKMEDVKTEEYDDVALVVYSLTKKSGVKKTPDIVEVGLNGSKEDKLKFVKENIDKEFSVAEFFNSGDLVDFRGVTTGRGFQGPVKR